MIHDQRQGGDASARVVVDETLIPQAGWIALEGYGPGPETPVLDLTPDQMEAARRLRAARRASSRAGGSRGVPARNVIPVGGRDLRARDAAQPFPTDDGLANDNLARAILLAALLMGVGGGYLYAARAPEPRPVIEVSPPDNRRILVTDGAVVLAPRLPIV